MALTAPLKIYKRKTTGSGTDKFDEICLDASNFKVTWADQTTTIPNQLERVKIEIVDLTQL